MNIRKFDRCAFIYTGIRICSCTFFLSDSSLFPLQSHEVIVARRSSRGLGASQGGGEDRRPPGYPRKTGKSCSTSSPPPTTTCSSSCCSYLFFVFPDLALLLLVIPSLSLSSCYFFFFYHTYILSLFSVSLAYSYFLYPHVLPTQYLVILLLFTLDVLPLRCVIVT